MLKIGLLLTVYIFVILVILTQQKLILKYTKYFKIKKATINRIPNIVKENQKLYSGCITSNKCSVPIFPKTENIS